MKANKEWRKLYIKLAIEHNKKLKKFKNINGNYKFLISENLISNIPEYSSDKFKRKYITNTTYMNL